MTKTKHPGIERRELADGSERFDVRYRLANGKVRTKTTRNITEAREFQAAVRVDRSKGALPDPKLARMTFDDWWARWWPSTVNLRPSSRARDESYPYRSPLSADRLLAQARRIQTPAILSSDRRSFTILAANDAPILLDGEPYAPMAEAS